MDDSHSKFQEHTIQGLHVISFNKSSQNDKILLFIHGAWHSSICWEKNFLPYFTSKDFPCYALDLRSHGKSIKKGKFKLISLGDYVEDVHTIVQELTKESKNIVFVAHSMGGLVAQKYLTKYPNTIHSAILLAPATSWGVRSITFRTMVQHPLTYVKMNLLLSFNPMMKNFKLFKKYLYYSETNDNLLKEYHTHIQDESYRAYINMLLSRVKHKSINIPLLVIGGMNDHIFKVKHQEKLASKLPQAESTFFDNTGHNVMLEKNWSLIADKMASWMEKNN